MQTALGRVECIAPFQAILRIRAKQLLRDRSLMDDSLLRGKSEGNGRLQGLGVTA
jgi:hypothetical protein